MSNYVASRTTPVQSAVNSVNTTADKIARNPLPVIETAVLTAVLTPVLGPGAGPAASAAVTYLNGGSPEDAAKAGAVSFAGQQAGEAYAPASQAPDNIDVGGGFNPATGAGDPTTAAGANVPTPVEKAGVKGATSGATRAALKGGSAEEIVSGGIVGGASGYGGAAASEELGLQPGSFESGLTQTIVGQSIGNYLSPTRSAQTEGGGATPSPTSVTTTGAGQSPGSQALSQALRIGDPGAPIFGGDKDKEGAKKSGWNVESLRYMGQES